MLTSDDVTRDAGRVLQLAEHLMLDQVEDLMLAQLKRLAREYAWHARDPRISLKQRTFSALITAAYNLSSMLADDLEWYHRFEGVLFEKEDGRQDFALANIFEAVLVYAFADEAQRWRKHAIKLAARLPTLSDTRLAAADIVHGLELVIAYEKLR